MTVFLLRITVAGWRIAKKLKLQTQINFSEL
jgi:hypothetical protein